MPQTIRQKTYLPNAVVGGAEVSLGLAPTPNTGVTLKRFERPVQVARLTLAAFVVSMTAANDFGGTLLVDLPNSKLLIVGTVVDLAVTVAGLATNTAVSLDVAVGTVTTASAAFSNAGEKDIVAKIDGVGATATGTVKGASAAAETNVLVAAGATNKLWLNASSPVTSGTGTATFTGTIDVYYVDLGTPSA